MVGEDGIAILPSAPVRTRSRDVEYRYRQDSDFYYLSGFAEPDAVAVIAPGPGCGRVRACSAASGTNGRSSGTDRGPDPTGRSNYSPQMMHSRSTISTTSCRAFLKREVAFTTRWAPMPTSTTASLSGSSRCDIANPRAFTRLMNSSHSTISCTTCACIRAGPRFRPCALLRK